MALESRHTCRLECGAPGMRGAWVPQQPCQQGPPTSLGYPGGQSSPPGTPGARGITGLQEPAQPKPGSPGNKYYTLRVLPEESLLQTWESRDNLRSVWHLQSCLREGSKGPALPGVCLWAACPPAGDTSDSGGQSQSCSRNLGGRNQVGQYRCDHAGPNGHCLQPQTKAFVKPQTLSCMSAYPVSSASFS